MSLLELFLKILGQEKAETKSRVSEEWTREGTHLTYEQKVWAQRRLKALGFYPHKIYREFVPGMITAVEAFQASRGIEVDGIIGAETWREMTKEVEVSKPAPATPEYYKRAMADFGLSEIAGAKHNPRIVEMFAKAGHSWVQDDETAWCAAAVNCWLEESGIKGTGQLNARSFLDWGKEYSGPAKQGVIAVLPRGTSAWQGHVTLMTGRTKDGLFEGLGGNQKNQVRKDWYPLDKVLGLRVPS